MPKFEDNRRKVVARLLTEGWTSVGGGVDENFIKEGHRMIQVPRHKTISQGVARTIAKAAGWRKMGTEKRV